MCNPERVDDCVAEGFAAHSVGELIIPDVTGRMGAGPHILANVQPVDERLCSSDFFLLQSYDFFFRLGKWTCQGSFKVRGFGDENAAVYFEWYLFCSDQ